ncbi:MAG: acetyl-CoA carboxylase biotin carboxylase subunit [Gemmatimonadetes bacterium]|nr:acetyl-CoA carboxylase biotin carboxylase subunit [Gemmatimonadota bacterium]MCY3942891.1 acetyl-CoA carboxylase biotin carboxylase subunit [Gemmatimonadota bacterium]
MLKSVLVANRGEIALRVVRAAQDLGIRAIAVFSEADRGAPHVVAADEAYHIGPAPAAESYLRIDRLLDAARRSGAEAIHPGYGFLAERAEFAEAVTQAGLVFVGPAAETIRAMGDKTEARRTMIAAGVPVVPGNADPIASPAEAGRIASEIGVPIVLKAAAGGGGKGMRVVEDLGEVARAYEACAREAEAAFGDRSVYVERYLPRPRHIEVQLCGDSHGRVVHLHERECSIQRRHQKLVEEAPSPLLGPKDRTRIGEAALRAAEAVGYVGAGTVEFLWQDDEFYFLEMNTRIQVEHPVTEMVTGVDLVEWQLRIASGEPLPLSQDEIPIAGHAIECRITSESPFDGFLPSAGSVAGLEVPGGPGVRWDGGVGVGSQIGLHYDPLLGKLIVHAADRSSAIRRMARALDEFLIAGMATSAPLLRRIMHEPDYLAGRLSTAYLEDHPQLLSEAPSPGEREVLLVAVALLEHRRRGMRAAPRIVDGGHPLPRWADLPRSCQPSGSGW